MTKAKETPQVSENMALWDAVCRTDPAVTKGAKIGTMNITAIGPQSQRKMATKMFGPYGIGWGVIPGSETKEFNNWGDVILCSYHATMFYVYNGERGEFPIEADLKIVYMTKGYNGNAGYLKVDEDYSKKIKTDAMTKGLSSLGFNSDVFEGKFDDCKYVQKMKMEFKDSQQLPPNNIPNTPPQGQLPQGQAPQIPQVPEPQQTFVPPTQDNTFVPDPIEWIKKYQDLTTACQTANMSVPQVEELVRNNEFNYNAIRTILGV